jgi:hypothetical protein
MRSTNVEDRYWNWRFVEFLLIDVPFALNDTIDFVVQSTAVRMLFVSVPILFGPIPFEFLAHLFQPLSQYQVVVVRSE